MGKNIIKLMDVSPVCYVSERRTVLMSIINQLLLLIVEVEDVFKLGSMKPGAMLYDANVEYEVSISPERY